jgi:hypothetical protein
VSNLTSRPCLAARFYANLEKVNEVFDATHRSHEKALLHLNSALRVLEYLTGCVKNYETSLPSNKTERMTIAMCADFCEQEIFTHFGLQVISLFNLKVIGFLPVHIFN